MSTKTNAEMLKTIKQYNKTVRDDKAKKEGFSDAAMMIAYLQSFVNNGLGSKEYIPLNAPAKPAKAPRVRKTPTGKITKPIVRPLIHVVDVLDSSGSMSGGKYDAATKGINIGIKDLKTDKAEVDYTYTMCDFSDDIRFPHVTVPLTSVETFRGRTRNSTSLYDAIGETIQKVSQAKGSDDKVLVNIYTDGQENSSKFYRADQISKMIEELSTQGWTFTFIGTAGDVRYAQDKLKFHASNTLVHDNTAESLARGMSVNSVARSTYSTKVAAGEDVSKDFYKEIE